MHTFEFNADRVAKAKQDFINNKIDDVVTVRHRNVCDKGFPFFPQGVDAVFLDLPTPWLVVDNIDKSLRPQGNICSFSPCIEQVQRTCLKLDQLHYEVSYIKIGKALMDSFTYIYFLTSSYHPIYLWR